jgi:glucosamine--fructose-6-phosphate aminotransferase (isomerizing)
MADVLKREDEFDAVAQTLAKAPLVLYLGRGSSYPLALEGALKLKEISYLHAEGFAAGELKHGPIALIDETVPVIALAPKDALFEKTVSNLQEVAARGGKLVVFSDAPEAQAAVKAQANFVLPTAHSLVNPILYAVPIQLLAYHAAVAMGTDVDQPRNLAKSVTVE